VLWVPDYFPREQEPELADLVPYRGVVVKHARVRKEGTHYVQYEDRQCRWQASAHMSVCLPIPSAKAYGSKASGAM
jgi:hypothetical protein